MPKATQESAAARRRSPRDRIMVAVAVLAAVGGYIAGIAGPSTAIADGRPRGAEIILPAHCAPPVVAIERGGYAVVGASDGRYYVVRADGTSCVVSAGRNNRDQLYWR